MAQRRAVGRLPPNAPGAIDFDALFQTINAMPAHALSREELEDIKGIASNPSQHLVR